MLKSDSGLNCFVQFNSKLGEILFSPPAHVHIKKTNRLLQGAAEQVHPGADTDKEAGIK